MDSCHTSTDNVDLHVESCQSPAASVAVQDAAREEESLEHSTGALTDAPRKERSTGAHNNAPRKERSTGAHNDAPRKERSTGEHNDAQCNESFQKRTQHGSAVTDPSLQCWHSSRETQQQLDTSLSHQRGPDLASLSGHTYLTPFSHPTNVSPLNTLSTRQEADSIKQRVGNTTAQALVVAPSEMGRHKKSKRNKRFAKRRAVTSTITRDPEDVSPSKRLKHATSNYPRKESAPNLASKFPSCVQRNPASSHSSTYDIGGHDSSDTRKLDQFEKFMESFYCSEDQEDSNESNSRPLVELNPSEPSDQMASDDLSPQETTHQRQPGDHSEHHVGDSAQTEPEDITFFEERFRRHFPYVSDTCSPEKKADLWKEDEDPDHFIAPLSSWQDEFNSPESQEHSPEASPEPHPDIDNINVLDAEESTESNTSKHLSTCSSEQVPPDSAFTKQSKKVPSEHPPFSQTISLSISSPVEEFSLMPPPVTTSVKRAKSHSCLFTDQDGGYAKKPKISTASEFSSDDYTWVRQVPSGQYDNTPKNVTSKQSVSPGGLSSAKDKHKSNSSEATHAEISKEVICEMDDIANAIRINLLTAKRNKRRKQRKSSEQDISEEDHMISIFDPILTRNFSVSEYKVFMRRHVDVYRHVRNSFSAIQKLSNQSRGPPATPVCHRPEIGSSEVHLATATAGETPSLMEGQFLSSAASDSQTSLSASIPSVSTPSSPEGQPLSSTAAEPQVLASDDISSASADLDSSDENSSSVFADSKSKFSDDI